MDFERQVKVDLTRREDHRAAELAGREVFGKKCGAELLCHNSRGRCVFAGGFEAQGTINLIWAEISGNLDRVGRQPDKGFYCSRDAGGG